MNRKKQNKSVKVLQVVGRMDRGGAESRLMDVFRYSHDQNMCFDFLVYTKEHQDYEDEIIKLGGRLLYIPEMKQSGLFRYCKNLLSLINKNGPYNAIHAHTSYSSAVPLVIAYLAGIRVRIYHARNSLSEKVVKTWSRKAYILLMKLLISVAVTHRFAVGENACIAHFGKNWKNRKNTYIIPNAIDLARYIPAMNYLEVKQVRKLYQIPEDAFILGHVGNFRPEKNHKYLIDVFHEVRKIDRNAILVLVGDDTTDEAKEISRYIEQLDDDGNVYFLGKQDKIDCIAKMFDVFVFPSLREGIPGAVLEAQALGIPCIVSENVDHSIDMDLSLIKWLSLENVNDWTRAIFEMKNRRIWKKEVIDDAYNKKGYSIDLVSEEWNRVYREGL